MDWYRYWNDAPRIAGEREFLRQVGTTVGGVPIDAGGLARILEQIRAALRPEPGHRLLDLCCGNGLLTGRLAGSCREIVGVDYSRPLLEIARAHHQPRNARYVEARLPDVDRARLQTPPAFDGVLMYEALQHFATAELAALLDRIRAWSAPGARVYLGSIPDRARLDAFYDTPERRRERQRRLSDGREAIGTWWEQGAVAAAAAAAGFTCALVAQNPDLHTAHYRFDALLVAG